MGKNPFFNNEIGFQPQQLLVQDIVDQMIDACGWSIYYIPRTHVNIDPVLTEDASSSFLQAFEIPAYINTYDGFSGQGDILSKFGLSQADQLTVGISRRTFEEDIGRQLGYIRPREGDLLFLPLPNAMFQISFVEHEASFYSQGGLYFYQISAEKFDFGSEIFNTGVPAIDILGAKYSLDTAMSGIGLEHSGNLLQENGSLVLNEEFSVDDIDPLAQNDEFDNVSKNNIVDFTETDPFNEGSKY